MTAVENANRLRARLADIARGELGQQEIPRGSNTGPRVKLYQQATELAGTGWPWCAAFVCWCVREWTRDPEVKAALPPGFRLPSTALAFSLERWGREQRAQIFASHPRVGDLVVYRFSHCGIVSSVEGPGAFHAVEGNTNEGGSREGYEVAERRRGTGEVKVFVRVPLIAPALAAAA